MNGIAKRLQPGLIGAALASLAACAPGPIDVGAPAVEAAVATAQPGPVVVQTPASASAVAAAVTTATAATALPRMDVYKSPTCGCCATWVEHVRKAGFDVRVHEVENLDPVKTRLGVPVGKRSCHTAEVGGYFVEGHVPADDIKRLLAEKPAAKGLVLPGMPMGSPGMEAPDGSVAPYTVELVARDGSTRSFSQHGQ